MAPKGPAFSAFAAAAAFLRRRCLLLLQITPAAPIHAFAGAAALLARELGFEGDIHSAEAAFSLVFLHPFRSHGCKVVVIVIVNVAGRRGSDGFREWYSGSVVQTIDLQHCANNASP